MAPGSPAGSQRGDKGAANGSDSTIAGLQPVQSASEEMVGVHQPLRTFPESIRLMHEGDLPWLLALCRRRYSSHFDHEGGEGWFRNIVMKAPLLFYPARTDNAFTITMLSCLPWLPNEWNADVVFTCADDGAMWEVISLLRRSIEWARYRRAATWRICSETDYDIASLAHRVGAHAIEPRYVLRL